MDRQEEQSVVSGDRTLPPPKRRRGLTRRQMLKYGLTAAAGLSGAGALMWYLYRGGDIATEIFKNDAPPEDVWRLWQNRGWVKEAYHYVKLGRNVQCRVCPNHCILENGDRSHCRNKVNRDGVLYTLAYGNPCSIHVDPIEKKPLFHFLPGTLSFSLATSGCVFRCLNCQNWEISQRKPEETKVASGPEFRLRPGVESVSRDQMGRLSLFPDDLAAMAQATHCPTISYTYSEPVAYYEYTYDSCKAARARKVRNVIVTCGSIEEESLRDLGQYLDAAHVDLKGFDEPTYRKLNTGRLGPILNTLKTLKSMGVWFEVVNLVVPTYTDNIDAIKKMCGWLVQNLGPDCPLHFSRFSPLHKLTQLTPTPVEILLKARSEAMALGLRYVYVGNVPGLPDVQDTFCPKCGKVVIRRDVFSVTRRNLLAGQCMFCQTPIAGVWS